MWGEIRADLLREQSDLPAQLDLPRGASGISQLPTFM